MNYRTLISGLLTASILAIGSASIANAQTFVPPPKPTPPTQSACNPLNNKCSPTVQECVCDTKDHKCHIKYTDKICHIFKKGHKNHGTVTLMK